jgi:transposase
MVYEIVRRHQRGESIRQIKKVTRIARKTIRKILDENEQRRDDGDDIMARLGPKPRSPRPSKLDDHLDLINDLLKKFSDITAQRVFEELQTAGFDGSYSTVRDHLREVRPTAAKRAHDPVHTPPGKQAQVDWSPYTIGREGESKIKIEALSSVLHFSRHQYLDFSDNRQRITLFRGLVESFNAFSGVPAELVFDSEKTVVDRWEVGEPIINLNMLDFAAYYRVAIHIAPRADGAYKGAVERPFRYLETSFFNGRTLASLEEARDNLAWWLEHRANCRLHRTTRRRPMDMLVEEQPHLQPLPSHPYDTSELGWRIADGFHRVSFETNTYTVPRQYVGHRLCLRATQDKVEIYDGYARLLATHERVPHGAHDNRELPEHEKQRRIDINKVMQRFETLGEAAADFATRLRHQQRYAGVELSSILNLQSRYWLEDILAAIDQALAYHAYKASAVERILEVNAKPLLLQDIVAERIRAQIRRTLVQVPVRQRGLDQYQDLFTTSGSEDNEEEENDQETPDDTD